MKSLLTLIFAVSFAWQSNAQDADPLSVTLPSGKVVHFQSVEQKARYDVARAARAARLAEAQRIQPPSAADSPKPAAAAPAPSEGLGHTALDEKPRANGVVNVNAPPFTAAYYMIAPETWVGKPVTLAVAYVSSHNEGEGADGLRRLFAQTWNEQSYYNYYQSSGGSITIVAPPAVAQRLLQQCGTEYRYNGGWRIRSTMIKGTITVLKDSGGGANGTKVYGFAVDS